MGSLLWALSHTHSKIRILIIAALGSRGLGQKQQKKTAYPWLYTVVYYIIISQIYHLIFFLDLLFWSYHIMTWKPVFCAPVCKCVCTRAMLPKIPHSRSECVSGTICSPFPALLLPCQGPGAGRS